MRMRFISFFLVVFMGGVAPVASRAAEAGWHEIGLEAGYQATPKREYFRQYGVFAIYGLPWEWRHSSGWGVTPNADLSVGIIYGEDETNYIGTAGATMTIDKQTSGFSADFGINASGLSRRHFGNRDFGSTLLFGSYMGANYRFPFGLKIGYRLQHTSNGHIFYPSGTPNPGLDLHIVRISYAF